MPIRSVIQPPAMPPAIDSASPMLTDTRPICAAENPTSTQNGFTMKPIAASGSLKTRMNSSTGRIAGRRRSSISAPKTGPRTSSSAGRAACGTGAAATDCRAGARPSNATSATASESARDGIKPESRDALGPLRRAVDQPQHPQHERREDGERVRRPRQRRELGVHAAARRGARPLARCDETGGRQHEEHSGRQHERAVPAEPLRGHQHETGREHADAIEADPYAVGEPELVLVEIFDRVAVDRDVVRRRQHGERADREPDRRTEAGLRREVQHRAAHGDVHGGHPAPVMPPVVDRGRPEKLERPREAEEREHADLAQLDALLAEVHREDLVEDAERIPFREIEDAHPEQLVREQRPGRGRNHPRRNR